MASNPRIQYHMKAFPKHILNLITAQFADKCFLPSY